MLVLSSEVQLVLLMRASFETLVKDALNWKNVAGCLIEEANSMKGDKGQPPCASVDSTGCAL